VGPALAHVELTFLCLLTLTLAFGPVLMPVVPRGLALVSALLLAVQTMAIRSMRIEPYEAGNRGRWEILDSTAEVVALILVPLAGAGLLTVMFWHLARANARVRHRLRAAQAAHAARAADPRGAGEPGAA
jgi:hypothetical protein